jgi:alkanesulfonate monooxygenase SsuD/methylene tetrahydromethanopterin reductase-like flavin-dependent oxidoreductase (luciferase family)
VQYAVNLPNFGPYADPRTVAGLAADAEAAGWDGLFVWDHVTFVKEWELEIGDPWIILAAAALATERLRLGPMITPLPRRRPSKLARETVTLDRLTGGRLVLGVGLGAPPEDEYGSFGEPTDAGTLAARLDEGLAVLVGLWSGEPFSFCGRHYRVDDVTFRPTPLQRPRIPVWVAGTWPGNQGPFRRAARWDGVVPLKVTEEPEPLTPDEVRGVVAAVRAERPGQAPFEVMVGGETSGRHTADDLELVGALADAGATWWSEWLNPLRGDLDEVRARIRQGPPRA